MQISFRGSERASSELRRFQWISTRGNYDISRGAFQIKRDRKTVELSIIPCHYYAFILCYYYHYFIFHMLSGDCAKLCEIKPAISTERKKRMLSIALKGVNSVGKRVYDFARIDC